MKAKLVAVMAMAAVAVSMASMAMSSQEAGRETREEVDEAKVQAAIDGRLHDLLVQMRMHRAGQ
jgi:hypothetical protein